MNIMRFLLSYGAASLLIFHSGRAAITWDNSSGDALWSNSSNWSGNVEPQSGDAVVFPVQTPSGGGDVTLGGGESARSLDFQNAYNLSGGDLALATGEIAVQNNGFGSPLVATIGSALQGSAGLMKNGPGTLVLGASTGYAGATTIARGTLQASATSGVIGAGDVLLSGRLAVVPAAVNGTTDIALATANAAVDASLTFRPGSSIALDRGGNRSVTMTIGNVAAAPQSALVRAAGGTLVISNAGGSANLGSATGERLFVNGGVAVTNGMVSPAIVAGYTVDVLGRADYLSYSTTTGFTRATYSASTNINGGTAGDTRIFNATTAQTLTADSEVYALRAAAAISGSFTLTVGSGGVIAGGGPQLPHLNFGAVEGLLFASGEQAGPVSVSGVTGTGGFTKFGPGIAVFGGSPFTSLSGGVRLAEGATSVFSVDVFGTNQVTLGGGSQVFGRATLNFQASGSFANPLRLDAAGGEIICARTDNLFVFSGLISGGAAAGSGQVSLRLSGGQPNPYPTRIAFGATPNTFTGDLSISMATIIIPAHGTADPTILGAGAKSIVLETGAVYQAAANGAIKTHDPPPGTKSWQIDGGGFEIDSGVTMILDDPGQLTGTGTFTKTGQGTLVLGSPANGQNAFLGAASVRGGILRLRHPDALGPAANSQVTLQSTTLQLRNDGAGNGGDINFGTAVTVIGGGNINIDRETTNSGNTVHLRALTFDTAGNTFPSLGVTGGNGYNLTVDGPTMLVGSSSSSIVPDMARMTLAGPITGNNSLKLHPTLDSHIFTIAGPASHTGGTFVEKGTLLLAPTGSITAGNITISQGATFDVSAVPGPFFLGSGHDLSNQGTIVGALEIAGNFGQGGGATVNGAVTAKNGGVVGIAGSINGRVMIENGGTFSAGVGTIQQFDLLSGGKVRYFVQGFPGVQVNGSLNLAGVFEGQRVFGYNPPVGSYQYLFRNDGIDPVNGTLAGLPEGAPVDFQGFSFTITYQANGDGGVVANDVALLTIVPEPASWVSVAAGLALLAGRPRKRKGNKSEK